MELTGHLNAVGHIVGTLENGTLIGKSAYEYAVEGGYTGTELEFTTLMNIKPRLIATYTHSGNKEVVVSAVDTTTDTFTSVAHGLANGDNIHATLNKTAAYSIFMVVVFGGHTTNSNKGLFVVNKADDTFQLSLTVGGAAIDLTVNATIDLTKWHFERLAYNTGITIAGLSGSKQLTVKTFGKSLVKSALYVCLNETDISIGWYNTNNATGYNNLVNSGDIESKNTVEIDTRDCETISCVGMNVQSSSSTVNVYVPANNVIFRPTDADKIVTQIKIARVTPANGYRIEVYKND